MYNLFTSQFKLIFFSLHLQVLWQVDTILFSLLVQRGLCDSKGRVWRNHSSQLYAVEVTVPELQVSNIRLCDIVLLCVYVVLSSCHHPTLTPLLSLSTASLQRNSPLLSGSLWLCWRWYPALTVSSRRLLCH